MMNTVIRHQAKRTLNGPAETGITTNYLNYLLSVSKAYGMNAEAMKSSNNNQNNDNNIHAKNKRGRKCYICSSKNHLSNQCPLKKEKNIINKNGLSKYESIIKGHYINEIMRDVMPFTFKLRRNELTRYIEYGKEEAAMILKDQKYKEYKKGINEKIKAIMKELRIKYNMPKKYNGKMFNYIEGLMKNFTNRKIRNSIKYDTVVEVECEERREVKRLAKKRKNKRSHARRRYNALINKIFKQQAAKFMNDKFDEIDKAAKDLNDNKVAEIKSELEAYTQLTMFQRAKIKHAEEIIKNKGKQGEQKTRKKDRINGEQKTRRKDKNKKESKATKVAQNSTIKKQEQSNGYTELLLNKKIIDMTPEECENILKIKDEVMAMSDDIAKMRFKMVEERYSFFVRLNYYKVKEVKQQKDKEIKEDKEFKKFAKELILENNETHEANITLAKMLYPDNPTNQIEYLEVHDKIAADVLAKRNVEECFSKEREQSPEDEYYYNEEGECCYYDQQDEYDD